MTFEPKKSNVLLVGSGILQAYGGLSWNKYLERIADVKERVGELNASGCPSPLQAIIITDDHIDVKLKENRTMLVDPDIAPECFDFCREILRAGFDQILTANYTYELEAAAFPKNKISEYALKKKLLRSTNDRVERNYLLHTYNEITFDGKENRVWHIHGEHRKPDSIILGHYYYGNLLFKIKEEVKRIDNNRWGDEKGKERGASWIDAFLFGDIYCMGFGFNVCEFDLWWLLNRKARERDNTGKLYYYRPKGKIDKTVEALFQSMRRYDGEPLVEIIDLDYEFDSCGDSNNYRIFNIMTLDDIKKRMQ